MATTVAADLAAGQIAMVAKARYTMEHIGVCKDLFTKMMLEPGNKSQYILKFGTAPALDLTDGVDMTGSSTLAITGSTHTTDEAGLKVIITKKLRNQLKEDAYKAAGVVIGNAIGKKIDQDGLALFSGLDSGLGAASTVLTLGFHAAGVAQCMGQSEPVPEPLVAVYHPYQINAFVDLLSATATAPPQYPKDVLSNYWRGRDKLYNTPIYGDGNITAGSACYGAIFSPMAFIYLVGWEPENWVEEDKSLRGWEIGVVADYAMVEEDGTYGRYMLFDATAPTS